MSAGQHIDYEALAQEAMRGVVRAVLLKVAQSGLIGDHHFYIAFNTQAPGVAISRRLKEKYPVEMTIVLQHRFWDLEVTDERFEVKLTFDGVPERLVIPFKSVKVFYDPSVPYGLQFEESELMSDAARRSNAMRGRNPNAPAPEAQRPAPAVDRADKRRDRQQKPRGRLEQRTEGEGGEAEAEVKAPIAAKPIAPPPAGLPVPSPAVAEAKPDEAAKPDGGASKVVDLSKFRKK